MDKEKRNAQDRINRKLPGTRCPACKAWGHKRKDCPMIKKARRKSYE